MMYKYKAKKGPGEIVEGTLNAAGQKEAVIQLEEMGLFPVTVELYEAEKENTDAVPALKVPRVRSSHVTIFSRQMASLLKSGVPILGAIDIIRDQSESPGLKKILTDVYRGVKEGATFSSMLARYPRTFPDIYVAVVRAGEDGGSLPESLLRIASYRTRQEELLSRLKMAAAYPALMAVVGVGTVIFMLTFVMPRLMEVFLGLNQELPAPTLILIAISSALRRHWIWISLGVFFLAAVLRKEADTRHGRAFMSALAIKTPVLGDFTLKVELARFSRTMEVLLKNGISILRATDIAVPVLSNEILKDQVRKSYKALEQGGSFGRSLKTSKYFPAFMSNLIVVGEESGKLDDALGEVADFYERETDEAVKVMSSLLEPMMILFIGSIVGFIVIAMLLPIFDISPMG